ncbi:AAA domain-containing protein [Streptomyces sp. NBC_00638]|uniref:AAA domain-containing protein n=1 Tax=Streptomyces sp. NBC_00638 TaxID=2975794 RepID=UPI002259F1EE|nr:AAA domain-containing protein [Streptomyces sp. NBC_00638]MCX5001873.1 AAA domain-containing protein [Streptomyces sp. NBC_00638]
MTHGEQEYWDQLVNRLFSQSPNAGRLYDQRSEPVVLLPGRLARVELSSADDPSQLFEAVLFKGIGPGAAPMWNRQLRCLLRLRALGHPGLPILHAGRHAPDERVAYAVTTVQGRSLAEARHRWREDERLQAVEQFATLLDGLSQLHSVGIHHRNIHLGAVRVFRDEELDDRYRCQLSRFEVSGLVRGLMGMRPDPAAPDTHSGLRELTLRPPDGVDRARHLAGLAPELLPYLFGNTPTLRTDRATTDVFGLGIIGWEWFCGPVAEILPEHYERLATAGADNLRTAVEDLQQEMRRHLTRASIPKQLAHLLREMIDQNPAARSTPYEATAALTACWSPVRAAFEKREAEGTLLLAYMAKQFGPTLWRHFEWISHDPDSERGRGELVELLERDLRRAELVHSPRGADGLVSGGRSAEIKRQAEWVLIGERALWFASYLREPRHDDPPDPRVLVIRFMLEKESWAAASLLRSLPRREITRVRLIPYKPGHPLGVDVTMHPSWRPLTDPLRRREKTEGRELLQSIDFLQEYQEVQRRSRWYPYERQSTEDGIVIRHDHGRDRDRARRNPLLAAYLGLPRARPTLGDFVDGFELDGEPATVMLGSDRDGRPSFHDAVKVSAISTADPNVVRVQSESGVAIPLKGWLRSPDDGGTDVQMDRQSRARRLLDERPGLIEQLISPKAVDTAVQFIDGSAGDGLDGTAPAIIRDICTVEPLYALQGPPGTGKSTVATRAIVEYLRHHPYTRLLVSAQSNFALDSLAAKIVKSVDPNEIVVIRATSQRGEVDDKVVAGYTLAKVQERYQKLIKKSVRARLARDSADDLVRESPEDALLKRWMERVDGNAVELGERLRRAAQITVATCSVSAQVLDYSRDGAAVFDWVLVEEAAKAWPNELLIPLVQGLRWTLIGDHRQLGAFRGEELERFLDHLTDQTAEVAQLHAGLKTQHLRYLNMFGSMFLPPSGESEETGDAVASGMSDTGNAASGPIGRLVYQFRMHRSIAEVVGRVFYPKDEPAANREEPLERPRERRFAGLPPTILDSRYATDLDHDLTEPSFLVGRALIWLDTGGLSGCGDEPSWVNGGEAKLVVRVARQLRPRWVDASEGPGSLAVLSPYRKQLKEIGRIAPELERAGRLHTVHSFQGREADQVLVSLVRQKQRGSSSRSNIGFIGEGRLVNVMLSRARRLLVIVGDLEHFRNHGTDTWRQVIQGVEQFGTVVAAKELTDEGVTG